MKFEAIKRFIKERLLNKLESNIKGVDDLNTDTRNIYLFLPRLAHFSLIFYFNHTSDSFSSAFPSSVAVLCWPHHEKYPKNHNPSQGFYDQKQFIFILFSSFTSSTILFFFLCVCCYSIDFISLFCFSLSFYYVLIPSSSFFIKLRLQLSH